MEYYLQEWRTFKVQFSIEIQISKEEKDDDNGDDVDDDDDNDDDDNNDDNEEENPIKTKKVLDRRTLNGFMFPVMLLNNVKVAVKVTINHLKERIDEFTRHGSGWCFERILNFNMSLMPFGGSLV